MFMQRLIMLFFGVVFTTPLVAGLMIQLFPLPGRLYTLVGWGMLVIAAFLWVGIRDGLTRITALRYRCTSCGATWVMRCGDRWPFEAIEPAVL
jgi:hypothetical protein